MVTWLSKDSRFSELAILEEFQEQMIRKVALFV